MKKRKLTQILTLLLLGTLVFSGCKKSEPKAEEAKETQIKEEAAQESESEVQHWVWPWGRRNLHRTLLHPAFWNRIFHKTFFFTP